MSLISDEAISLRRTDYSETSQIIVLLTRGHGLARVIAKGSKRSTKKGFRTGIDLLERGEVVVSLRADRAGDLSTLVEWTQRELYAGLRGELSRLYGAQYMAEVTPALLESGDPHPGLFAALAGALASMSRGKNPVAEVVRYQRALLVEVGLMPELTCCASCGGEIGGGAMGGGAVYFSSGSGGLVCRDCEPTIVEKRGVSPTTLTWLAGGGEIAGGKTDAALAGAFDLLNYHIACTLGRQPKLADYVQPAAQRRRI